MPDRIRESERGRDYDAEVYTVAQEDVRDCHEGK